MRRDTRREEIQWGGEARYTPREKGRRDTHMRDVWRDAMPVTRVWTGSKAWDAFVNDLPAVNCCFADGEQPSPEEVSHLPTRFIELVVASTKEHFELWRNLKGSSATMRIREDLKLQVKAPRRLCEQ